VFESCVGLPKVNGPSLDVSSVDLRTYWGSQFGQKNYNEIDPEPCLLSKKSEWHYQLSSVAYIIIQDAALQQSRCLPSGNHGNGKSRWQETIATFDDTGGLQSQVTLNQVLDAVVSLPPGCQQLPLPLPGLAAAGAAT